MHRTQPVTETIRNVTDTASDRGGALCSYRALGRSSPRPSA